MTKELHKILFDPKNTRLKIDRLCIKREIKEYSLMPSGVRYDKPRVTSSPVDDQMSSKIAEIDEIDRELLRLKRDFKKQTERICKLCDGLPNPYEQTVLTMFYVGNKKMETIADTIGYALSTTYKIKRQGEEALESLIK